MFCNRCGSQITPGANFCLRCGAPTSQVLSSGAPDHTTASIEVGDLDEVAAAPSGAELEPGTGALVVIRGPNAGARFLLDRDVTTVGRHPDSDIFLHDVTVSRRHCDVRRSDVGLTLTDLGSLNGTYVNGERADATALAGGDEVQVGRFKLLFLAAPDIET